MKLNYEKRLFWLLGKGMGKGRGKGNELCKMSIIHSFLIVARISSQRQEGEKQKAKNITHHVLAIAKSRCHFEQIIKGQFQKEKRRNPSSKKEGEKHLFLTDEQAKTKARIRSSLPEKTLPVLHL